jgi:hypothetical protein
MHQRGPPGQDHRRYRPAWASARASWFLSPKAALTEGVLSTSGQLSRIPCKRVDDISALVPCHEIRQARPTRYGHMRTSECIGQYVGYLRTCQRVL